MPAAWGNVEVDTWTGLTTAYRVRRGATVIVRGVRTAAGGQHPDLDPAEVYGLASDVAARTGHQTSLPASAKRRTHLCTVARDTQLPGDLRGRPPSPFE